MAVKMRMKRNMHVAPYGGPGTVFECDEDVAATLVVEGYADAIESNSQGLLVALKGARDRKMAENSKKVVLK